MKCILLLTASFLALISFDALAKGNHSQNKAPHTHSQNQGHKKGPSVHDRGDKQNKPSVHDRGDKQNKPSVSSSPVKPKKPR